MTDKVLTELFAQPIPEPPLPPDHMERLLSRARRERRRLGLRGALAALLAIVLAAVVPAALPYVGSRGDRVRLPDHLSGYFPLTATVADRPPGRSLLLLRSGSWELVPTYQTLLVGTDGSTYRDLGDDDQSMLSPDGSMVIICLEGIASSSLTLVDLTTGERRSIPLERPRIVRLHAWSPDLRLVAYTSVDDYRHRERGLPETQRETSGILSILDLRTGREVSTPNFVFARAAAFASDSRSLAVQDGPDEAWVIRADDGSKQRRLALPPGTGIAPGTAWSPDGRLIATVPWLSPAQGTPAEAQLGPVYSPAALTIGFANANGVPLADPKPVTGRYLLGWRSPRSIITISYDTVPRDEGDTGTIEEIDLITGQATVLSRVEHGHACQLFTERCLAGQFQLATGLLDRMEVTSSGLADRGPRLAGVALGLLVIVMLLALVLVRWFRSWRSSHRSMRAWTAAGTVPGEW